MQPVAGVIWTREKRRQARAVEGFSGIGAVRKITRESVKGRLVSLRKKFFFSVDGLRRINAFATHSPFLKLPSKDH